MKAYGGTIDSMHIKVVNGDNYNGVTFINCDIDNMGITELWAENCYFDKCQFTEGMMASRIAGKCCHKVNT